MNSFSMKIEEERPRFSGRIHRRWSTKRSMR